MTVQTTFFDWPRSGLDWQVAPWNACSLNLHQNRGDLDVRFGRGDYLGCHADRTIRDGDTVSEHAFGASLDWRYPAGTKDAVLKHLIETSRERHVVGIHDYVGCRIWHAGRTSRVEDAYTTWWKAQTPNPNNGMGQAWAAYLHITTHRDGFFDSSTIASRLNAQPEAPQMIDFSMIPSGSKFYAPDKSPVRLVDTRIGQGAPAGKVDQNHPLRIQLPQWPGIVTKSAVVNVTLVEPDGDGFARVYGPAAGDGSNINVTSGQSPEPSPTIVAVDGFGGITVQTTRTTAHVLVDLLGVVAD